MTSLGEGDLGGAPEIQDRGCCTLQACMCSAASFFQMNKAYMGNNFPQFRDVIIMKLLQVCGGQIYRPWEALSLFPASSYLEWQEYQYLVGPEGLPALRQHLRALRPCIYSSLIH